jgi:ferrous iron transport protein A
MVRRAPLRDPVIFRVGDYEIALRGAQTRSIHVDLLPDAVR